jgi:polyphosphate kinase 2 (PPK2 family)
MRAARQGQEQQQEGGAVEGVGAAEAAQAAHETELFRLQGELVKMREWMRTEGARISHLRGPRRGGPGRPSRVAQYLNPAWPGSSCPRRPSGARGYFQRYIDHLPAAGG